MNNSLTPLVTEKSSQLVAENVYAFVVTEDMNKAQVRTILEKMYKVTVASVRMVKKAGKTRRVGRRMQTKKMPDIKVAYVKLKEGKIDVFPQA